MWARERNHLLLLQLVFNFDVLAVDASCELNIKEKIKSLCTPPPVRKCTVLVSIKANTNRMYL